MMTIDRWTTPTSIYLHVPFCERICSYCDFYKIQYQKEFVKSYLKALSIEIDQAKIQNIMNTIYIGGGTPSVLSANELNDLLRLVQPFCNNQTEWTVEVNPNDVTNEKMEIFASQGVNRWSVGIQTFQDSLLHQLHRSHSSQQAHFALRALQNRGVNFSADLIYGLPNQSMEMLHDDIEKLLEYRPPHISCYALQVEPHTLMSIQGIPQTDDDELRNQYDWILSYLLSRGYRRYEVSNFALPGYESLHNQTYWRSLPYYGFGPGASGYLHNQRYSNTKKFHDYIDGKWRGQVQMVAPKEQEFEFFMLGLRMEEGISLQEYYNRFHENFYDNYQEILPSLLEEKLVRLTNSHLAVTDKGFYILDYVLLRLTKHLEY
jgi:oxygen-independent coproporphyrinogen-3 oxidase